MATIQFKVDDKIKLKLEDPQTRSVQIVIQNEELLLQASTTICDDWKKDLEFLDWKEPCFHLFRIDGFVLLHYLPMSTPVKEKMIYSIAKQYLVKEFQISNSILGGERKDFSPELIQDSFKTTLVFTDREVEKQQMMKQHAEMAIGLSTRGNSASITFPCQESLLVRLKEYQNNDLIVIGLENEAFKLTSHTSCSIQDVSKNLPTNEPLFFVHKDTELIFGYISPPSTPIKTRMLFAASKSNLVSFVESLLGPVDKKVELDSAEEFEEEIEEKPVVQKGFSRPARPGRK